MLFIENASLKYDYVQWTFQQSKKTTQYMCCRICYSLRLMTLWLQPIQDKIHSHTSIITLHNCVGAGHASDVKTRLNISLTILNLMHNITISILYNKSVWSMIYNQSLLFVIDDKMWCQKNKVPSFSIGHSCRKHILRLMFMAGKKTPASVNWTKFL